MTSRSMDGELGELSPQLNGRDGEARERRGLMPRAAWSGEHVGRSATDFWPLAFVAGKSDRVPRQVARTTCMVRCSTSLARFIGESVRRRDADAAFNTRIDRPLREAPSLRRWSGALVGRQSRLRGRPSLLDRRETQLSAPRACLIARAGSSSGAFRSSAWSERLASARGALPSTRRQLASFQRKVGSPSRQVDSAARRVDSPRERLRWANRQLAEPCGTMKQT
jgi:hypothetical protein